MRTERGNRVFFPGDELPKGVTVMDRDRNVTTVKYPGMKVSPWQPEPLIEVLLPDFESLHREAFARREIGEGRL